MDYLTSKKNVLEAIRISEGVGFECDETAILHEYQRQGENTSSLAIKILSVIGGFFATLAFIGFLLIAGLYDSELGLVAFGIAFLILAIWLNRKYDNLIIDTFSVSSYIVGFALFASGLTSMSVNVSIIAILIGIIAICSLFVTQNYILSLMSVLAISASFLILIAQNEFYNLIHLYIVIAVFMLTYVIQNEAKLITSNKKFAKLYNPVRIGLVISLLFGLMSIGKRNLIPISQDFIWLSSVAMFGIIIYLVYCIVRIIEMESLKDKVLVYTLSSMLLGTTLFAPAISGAIVIVLLSFLVNYRTGFAVGIIAFIYFMSQYYYDLNFTLLTKSIILFSSGIVFLLFYLFTTIKQSTHGKI